MFEAEDAAEIVRQSANTDINIIFGAVINENLNDEVIVTVIATGFEDNDYSEPEKKTSSTPTRSSKNDDDSDFDIPSFLRDRDDF